MNLTAQRVVFFDLDGTLHKQDMFGSFLRYLLIHLPLNIVLVISVLPVVILGLLVKGRLACWPMSLLLWSITFGHSEDKLQALQVAFAEVFCRRVRRFPQVLTCLNDYLTNQNAQVWLITGSPESLVKKVYYDAVFLSKIQLIGSHMNRHYGGWILTMRCLGREKVKQLKRKLGIPLKLYSGYSDSIHDSPLLYFCEYRWRVTHDGQLKQLD